MRLTSLPGIVRFEVRVRPRAKATRVVGEREGVLDVSLAAPPVDGAANEELVRFMADLLGVARRAVRIARGASGRSKLLEVHGLTSEEVLTRLARDRVSAP